MFNSASYSIVWIRTLEDEIPYQARDTISSTDYSLWTQIPFFFSKLVHVRRQEKLKQINPAVNSPKGVQLSLKHP